MTTLRKAAQDQIKAFMERIERVEEEVKELRDDIKSIYAEAKSAGFDTTALRKLIQLRKKDAAKRAEEEALLDTYMHAVGMASETPLFKSVGAMSVDRAAREQVIDAFKTLVPDAGEIIVKMGGNPIRLWRDDKGKAHAEDYREPEAKPPPEKTGKALKKGAAVLKMVPGGKDEADRVKDIADRAEERSSKQKEKPADAPADTKEPEPV